MIFRRGQRVVCVDASLPANPWHRQHPLVKNRIYEIFSVHPCSGYLDIDGSMRLWESSRFRPIIDRPTDISIFTRLLAPSEPERVS